MLSCRGYSGQTQCHLPAFLSATANTREHQSPILLSVSPFPPLLLSLSCSPSLSFLLSVSPFPALLLSLSCSPSLSFLLSFSLFPALLLSLSCSPSLPILLSFSLFPLSCCRRQQQQPHNNNNNTAPAELKQQHAHSGSKSNQQNRFVHSGNRLCFPSLE